MKLPVFCSPNESTDEMGGGQSSDKQDCQKERIFSLLVSYDSFAILPSRKLGEFKEEKSIISLC